MKYIKPWGVGGVSMYEIVNRIILRENTSIFKTIEQKEPFGEIRNSVMTLATKIMRDKITWFQNVVLTDGFTFFPLKLDYSWPEPFDLIMAAVGCTDKFRIKPMYNMTTKIPDMM